jgi:hypothetical protein
MAKTTAGRGSSGSQLTLVWMALAILLVVGFMYWLAVSSEPSQMVMVQEDGDDAPAVTDAPTAVSLEEFAANPAQYRGRNIELEGVTVAARVGTQAFWINLANQPFLVRIAPSIVAEGRTVEGGQTVTISGPVFARTDSILTAWEQEGVITSEGQRMEVEFAESFLEARRIVAGQPAAR